MADFVTSYAKTKIFTLIVLAKYFHSLKRKALINMDETAKFTHSPNKESGPLNKDSCFSVLNYGDIRLCVNIISTLQTANAIPHGPQPVSPTIHPHDLRL
jgi:hypothetical protein